MTMDKEIRKALDKQFEKMKKELVDTITGLISKLEEKVVSLEAENSELRYRLDSIEKYERGDCLELHNVPQSPEENLQSLVCGIAEKMNVTVTSHDISTVYRIPQAKNNQNKTVSPRIFVKFVRRNTKRQLYAARSKQGVTHKDLGFQSKGKIYIRENLTKTQNKLYFAAKDKVEECGFKFLWTQDQNIYVRATDKSKRISINNESDLAKITDSTEPADQTNVRITRRHNSTTAHA